MDRHMLGHTDIHIMTKGKTIYPLSLCGRGMKIIKILAALAVTGALI